MQSNRISFNGQVVPWHTHSILVWIQIKAAQIEEDLKFSNVAWSKIGSGSGRDTAQGYSRCICCVRKKHWVIRSYLTGPCGRSSFFPLAGHKWPRCGLALTRQPSGGSGAFALRSLSHSTTLGLNNSNSVNAAVTWPLEVSIIEQWSFLKRYKDHHNPTT